MAVAEDKLVVIANPDTEVETINKWQVTQIFLRQVQTWPDGKAIHPYDLKDGSPVRIILDPSN